MTSDPAPDLFSRFARVAARAPERIALASRGLAGEEIWSYARLFAAARTLARGLRRRGLAPGDRVAFLLGNRPELVVGWLALAAAGAALVPINLAYRRREIAHILADAEPRLLLAGADERAAVDQLEAAERRSLEAVIPVEELAGWAEEEPAGTDPLAPLAPVGEDDLALLLYTSGTTGRSKGAMLSHGNVGAMIDSLHEAWRWSAADTLLLALPLFHLHGLVVGLACALAAGATVELERRFDAATTVDELAAARPTLFFGVPTIYFRLVEELARRGGRLAFPAVRLFVSGSAPLPAETFEAFRVATGQEILERYGMTETGMLAGNPLAGPRRPGTVGLPLPGVELRLVDDDGRPVADGAEGEVEARGANVCRGYWRAPEKSAESFRADPAGGRPWFRTGDVGRRDPATGYLTLLGRRSELILSGGFNVYPREVEETLLQFPGVQEAAVVGERNPEWGESPVAFLVADHELDPAALDRHCRVQLAAFKCPRRFVLLAALPRNAMGKVEKRRLLER